MFLGGKMGGSLRTIPPPRWMWVVFWEDLDAPKSMTQKTLGQLWLLAMDILERYSILCKVMAFKSTTKRRCKPQIHVFHFSVETQGNTCRKSCNQHCFYLNSCFQPPLWFYNWGKIHWKASFRYYKCYLHWAEGLDLCPLWGSWAHLAPPQAPINQKIAPELSNAFPYLPTMTLLMMWGTLTSASEVCLLCDSLEVNLFTTWPINEVGEPEFCYGETCLLCNALSQKGSQTWSQNTHGRLSWW